jgi:U3 small nucleolar RNA-associated protein 3
MEYDAAERCMQGTAGVCSERIQRDSASLSREDREEAVLKDAPELLSLLQDLAGSFHEVRTRTSPLLAELHSGGLATDAGISYLETKHMLLLMYCLNSLFYVLLKLEGRPVSEHPVITRLVTIKAFLEKLRPIDKRLKSQIDKLLRASEFAYRGSTASDGAAPPAPSSCVFMVKPVPFYLV